VAKLIVATGRRPNSDNIGIGRAGVELGKEGQIRVDELGLKPPHAFRSRRDSYRRAFGKSCTTR
jgi:hypothetical protein